MPQPVGGDLHVNVPLTNVSVSYLTDQSEFIADKVFPIVPVEYKSNTFWKYNKGEWMKTVALERAPATESVGTGWTVTSDTYNARVFSVHKDVSDQDRAIADRPVFDLDRDGTILVMRDLGLKRELDWVARYFTTGIWTNADQTGVASAPTANQFVQWNQSSATPIKDIRARMRIIQAVTGFKPNKLVLGPQVMDALLDSPDIIDRIKYTQRGFVSEDMLAGVLGVDQVLVPEAIQNTAVEGAADAIGLIYGKSALLVYAAPNAGLLVPSAGYTFAWTGYLGAQAFGQRMKKFRMEPIASDRIEGEMAYDMKLVGSDLGIFFATAVA